MSETNDRSGDIEDMFHWVEANFETAKARFTELGIIREGIISFVNPVNETEALIGIEKDGKRYFVKVTDIRIEEVAPDDNTTERLI